MEAEVAAIKAFMESPRFRDIKRDYTAEDVYHVSSPLPLRGGIGAHQSQKMFDLLTKCSASRTASVTWGALDPIQVISMAAYTTSIYVSGWQCSSTASTSNEPGPDLADYPYTTVPNKVDQLVRAQELHSRRQREERSRMTPEQRAATPEIDYFRPIIADADTGHGGTTACMRLAKMFIEAGAAGIHIEDQCAGTKKCGHMGGKVLCSIQQHITRLKGVRLEADINRSGLLIVARTDSDAAKYLDTNIDARDHPFIVGEYTGPDGKKAKATFTKAVRAALEAKGDKANLDAWNAVAYSLGHKDAVAKAASLGVSIPDWDWEACRSIEGYFSVDGGTDYAIQRAIAFAPYADICWMETAKPVPAEAKKFADAVLKVHPRQFLAYNLSPSFNWDAAGLTDADLKAFSSTLGSYGFCWQFITLAGFHADGLIAHNFARAFQEGNMLAYCEVIQRQERKDGVPLLTHQKWSGAELVDRVTTMVNPQAVTSIMSEGVTEVQFAAK